ncbi:MAG: hypothetical protein LDL41_03950 [Coleofasciculus sp. S288]|nr:hypothetical protein [Coleofasciculus sp. S288]
MKKLTVIFGMVLLSGTDALAANLKTVDGVKNNSIEPPSLLTHPPTQLTSIKADRDSDSFTQEDKLHSVKLRRNLQLIVAQFGPPDRGNPDDRGNSADGGAR